MSALAPSLRRACLAPRSACRRIDLGSSAVGHLPTFASICFRQSSHEAWQLSVAAFAPIHVRRAISMNTSDLRKTSTCSLAAVLLAVLAACSTHPDSLHLDKFGVEIVQSHKYLPSRPEGEHALAFLFEGQAPFASIARAGRIAQFECGLFDPNEKPLSDTNAGRMYLDQPAMPADPVTGLLSTEDGERYRYRAVLFWGLKWRTVVNGPLDIDLANYNYDHIVCHLRGSQMAPTIWVSNDLRVSKEEIAALIGKAEARAAPSTAP